MTACVWWLEVLVWAQVACLLLWTIALPLRWWQMLRLEQAVREFRRQTRKVTDTYLPGAEVLKHLDSDNKE
jgi:protein-S-isoprenylcysteine O-methyltransferase Ste14